MKKLLAGMVILSLGLFTLGCGGETKTPPKKDAGAKTPVSAPEKTPEKK
jgi:hypothetical protein